VTRYVLALDQGTTSSRSMLFDRQGEAIATAQREFTQFFPQPGFVEHDPEEIWATQRATIDEVLRRAGATPRDLAGIGITNQRETTVLWDRSTGRAITPAIVWQDRRTAPLCEALRAAGYEPEIARRSGLLLDPYFSGTKLRWMLDNVPGARARAERGEIAFGTIDSWLIHKLTEGREHVTDASNASRTLLFNLASGEWDPQLLDWLRIPPTVLPRVVASSGASLRARWAGHDVPIAGIAGDQQAALFGQACFRAGMAKNTYGTGCFLLLNTGTLPQASRHRLLTTVAWQREQRQYALEGSVFMGGAIVQWLRDGLGLIEKSSDVESLAATVPDNGGVYLVPAFTGLGAPHWDPHARGTVLGLTRGSTRGHIARAALEAIAFQSAEVLQAMRQDAVAPLRELRVDGGASRNDLLMQFQADLLQVAVVRSAATETTALGAAFLAGLGVGFWDSEQALESLWREERRFEPSMPESRAQELQGSWARAVECCRGWAQPPA
jgi:glycerol kinase